jgi:hypothetical protein
MLILHYASKKELKEAIGRPLAYETSLFDAEYHRNGKVIGSNRPSITGINGREFFAEVTLRDGLIAGVL